MHCVHHCPRLSYRRVEMKWLLAACVAHAGGQAEIKKQYIGDLHCSEPSKKENLRVIFVVFMKPKSYSNAHFNSQYSSVSLCLLMGNPLPTPTPSQGNPRRSSLDWHPLTATPKGNPSKTCAQVPLTTPAQLRDLLARRDGTKGVSVGLDRNFSWTGRWWF